jgi:hypothetical protein
MNVTCTTNVNIDPNLLDYGRLCLYCDVSDHMLDNTLDTLHDAIKELSLDIQSLAQHIKTTAEDLDATASVSRIQYSNYAPLGGCLGVSIYIIPEKLAIKVVEKVWEAGS